MARQEIILGTAPTGLGGDPPRTASQKINFMTQELYEGLPTTAAPLPIAKGGTGGKTPEAARTGLGLRAAALMDVVGAGGIIEFGATVNGEFTKLIDGTLICRLPIKQTAYVTVNVLRYPWSFPSLFLAGTVPNISITIHGIIGINRQISGAVPIGPSNTGIALDIYSKAQFVAGDEVNAQVSAIAIGRWKA